MSKKEINIKIYLVINTSKYETSSEENIVEYINFSQGLNKKPWKSFSGFISNTHFGDDTTIEDIKNGYNKLKSVSEKTSIPIISVCIPINLKNSVSQNSFDNTDIWFLDRMMPKAFW